MEKLKIWHESGPLLPPGANVCSAIWMEKSVMSEEGQLEGQSTTNILKNLKNNLSDAE